MDKQQALNLLQARRQINLAFELLENSLWLLEHNPARPQSIIRGLEVIIAAKTELLAWFEVN